MFLVNKHLKDNLDHIARGRPQFKATQKHKNWKHDIIEHNITLKILDERGDH